MAVRNLIVLNNPSQWVFDIDDAEAISAKAYLTDSRYAAIKHARVFNLCRSYRYQSLGYYVSLLAAARDHHAIPDVTTMQDVRSQTLVRTIAGDLDDLVQKTLADIEEKEISLYVYFGQTVLPQYRHIGRSLYQLFQTPLMKVTFVKTRIWLIQQILPLSLGQIPETDRSHIPEFARSYFSRKRFPPSRIQHYSYDLAILVHPDEPNPPSCARAIKKFEEAADRLHVYTERITREDYSRLTEFDALFIRATTAVNHFTYRFARKAFAEGLAVIDDPFSILRCTNKVYLAERLTQAGIPIPRTRILHKDQIKGDAGLADLTYPCVLKQPDSAFSKGVVKANDPSELHTHLQNLFEKSDLLIAQEFLETEYDWRIGILDHTPLYACRYYMARGHWQICNWAGRPNSRFGKADAVPLYQVPTAIVETAVHASRLIGDGLYGVDLKEVNGRAVVIEVNDNPSIDSGVEDLLLKDELYREIIRSIVRRVDRPLAGR